VPSLLHLPHCLPSQRRCPAAQQQDVHEQATAGEVLNVLAIRRMSQMSSDTPRRYHSWQQIMSFVKRLDQCCQSLSDDTLILQLHQLAQLILLHLAFIPFLENIHAIGCLTCTLQKVHDKAPPFALRGGWRLCCWQVENACRSHVLVVILSMLQSDISNSSSSQPNSARNVSQFSFSGTCAAPKTRQMEGSS
jgi:hypothetical protein